jgi:predicted nucleotidyltransferase component of viral defense system
MEEKSGVRILTDLQERVLEIFFSVPELKEHFYLTGGTALSAFYLQHRLSDDLDMFTHSMEIEDASRLFEDAIKSAGLQLAKERSSATFRRYKVDGSLQVDIVRDVDFRIGAPQLKGAFMVDSPQNIAMNKVVAIYGRLDAKDYVDLYFLKPVLNFDIMELIETAKNKDGGMDAFQWARVIMDAESLEVLPRMIKEISLKDLKKFFADLRREILLALAECTL